MNNNMENIDNVRLKNLELKLKEKDDIIKNLT